MAVPFNPARVSTNSSSGRSDSRNSFINGLLHPTPAGSPCMFPEPSCTDIRRQVTILHSRMSECKHLAKLTRTDHSDNAHQGCVKQSKGVLAVLVRSSRETTTTIRQCATNDTDPASDLFLPTTIIRRSPAVLQATPQYHYGYHFMNQSFLIHTVYDNVQFHRI